MLQCAFHIYCAIDVIGALEIDKINFIFLLIGLCFYPWVNKNFFKIVFPFNPI